MKTSYILLTALLIRCVFALSVGVHSGTEAFLSPDSSDYLTLAESLVESGVFAREGQDEIVRTPGYPLLIALSALLGQPVVGTVFLQILLSVLSVWLVFLIAKEKRLGEKKAKRASLFYSFEPLSIYYCSQILTETLFTAFFLIAVFLFLRSWKEPLALSRVEESPKQILWLWIVTGLFLGFLPLIRPIALFLPVLFILTFIFLNKRSTWVKPGFVLILPSLLLVFSWIARNEVVSGYATFSTIPNVNLYRYHGAGVKTKRDDISMDQAQAGLDQQLKEQHFENQVERFQWMREKGLALIQESPPDFTWNYVLGVIRVIGDPEATRYLQAYGQHSGGLLNQAIDRGTVNLLKDLCQHRPKIFWLTVLLALWLLFLWLMAFLGVFQQFRGKVFLISLVLYFLLTSGGPNAHGRFRHPIMPILCLLAVAGTFKLNSQKSSHLQ